MKSAILISLAALALAGAAVAQIDAAGAARAADNASTDHVQPYPMLDPANRSLPMSQYSPNPAPIRPITPEVIAQLKVMRLACIADRQTLCADKKSDIAADRCVHYHRLKVSTPCRQSLDKVHITWDVL